MPAAVGGAAAPCLLVLLTVLFFSISPHFRNPRAKTKIILWTSAVLIFSNLEHIATSTTRKIEKIAREINASAPQMADVATRIDGANAGPGRLLTIRVTFVQIDGKNLDRAKWRTTISPRLRDNAVKNTGTRKMLLSGVNVVYRFYGRDGVLIDEMQLTAKDIRDHQ